ncbi:PD-(D/E)XK nuclease family protein, partial [Microvirga pudoricolor]|uniref:PD-(D/E)XK nuclease family protein n=1 Tax=Microvirga pudoricolor TaxID=2778729 RepID=UPI00194E3F84
LLNDGPDRLPVWSPGAKHDCAVTHEAREERDEKGRQEHNRLLYVAMTRAKDRLVIAPYWMGSKEAPENAWCEMIRRGLVAKVGGLVRDVAPYGEIDVWRDGKTRARPAEPPAAPSEPVTVPEWLTRPVPQEPEPLPPIRPSGALGAADRITRPGDGPYAPEARLRGTLVHALLERLPAWPEAQWVDLSRAYVKARAPRLPAGVAEAVVANALNVLAHEALNPLFGPASRAEAPIAGQVMTASGPLMVSGQIDRLAVLDREVLVADFKTTARPPRPGEPPPAAYVAQLALYRLLLQDIYPDKTVRTFLVWTSGPVIQELRAPDLDRALTRIAAA